MFPRWFNYLGPAVAVAVAGGLGSAIFVAWYWFSPLYTDVGYSPKQPVPFSHKLHAGDLGMDCRYCHNTIEKSAYAAIPPTSTCMNCHKHVLPESEALAPIRTSAATGEPVHWVRVHMLPDFAYFDHSVHLAAGVGCVTCHGRIDQMKRVYQAEPLSMSWCLDCHRNPTPNLRPRSEVTNMTWSAPPAGYDPLKDPNRERLPSPPETCFGCHR